MKHVKFLIFNLKFLNRRGNLLQSFKSCFVSFNILNSIAKRQSLLKFNINESGLTLMIVLVAFLVLFTTFSFIKVGSLQTINPDLRRIGINIGPGASPAPLADDQTTNPNQADSQAGTSNQSLTIASNALDIDASQDVESEADNPTYIE